VSRALAFGLTLRGSAPNQAKMSHTSRKNWEDGKTSRSNKETYRCRGEDQLIERVAH
jgi:hypothetical protein